MGNNKAVGEQPLWQDPLADPEVQESLTVLIQKLPQIKEMVLSAEKAAVLVSSIAQDQTSLKQLGEKWDRLTQTHQINEETWQALITLLDKLPTLLTMIETLEKVQLFVQSLMQDKSSIEYLGESVKSYLAPVTEKLDLVKEAQERAKQDQTKVSLFTILRWMKEPAVQDSLKFIHALLQVWTENCNRK